MPSPQVVIQVESAPRRIAHARWDSDSLTFTCSVRAVEAAAPSSLLRDQLDTLLRVEAPERRLALGGVDILLDEMNRPVSIEFYSNPARWKPVRAERLEALEFASVSLELRYDTNGIASMDAPVSIEHDALSAILILRFGEAVSRWVAFAEGMSIGVNEEHRLAAIRFQPVPR